MSQSSGFFISLAKAGDITIAPTAAVGITAPAWIGWLQHISAEAAILLPLATLLWITIQLVLKIVELVLRLRKSWVDDDDPPDVPGHHS